MIMATVIIGLAIVIIAFIVFKLIKTPDLNNDGKVDVKDVVEATKQVAEEVKTEAVAVVEKVKKARKPKKIKAE
jgi:hypothetical protein